MQTPRQTPLDAQVERQANATPWLGFGGPAIDEIETQVTESVGESARMGGGFSGAPGTPVGQQVIDEIETQVMESVGESSGTGGGFSEAPGTPTGQQVIDEIETQVTESVGGNPGTRGGFPGVPETPLGQRATWRHAPDKPPAQPSTLQQRRRRSLIILAVVLLCVACLGIIVIPLLEKKLSSSASTSTTALQHALNPSTTVSNSTALSSTADSFMRNMQQKNWATLWSMLLPSAQALWQGEQDFTHFEQTKFGSLTLQSYSLSQAVITTPWLDTDTTQIYSSAALVHVSLQASAPNGVLTVRSQRDLSQGLFKNTLLALVQNGKTWQVAVAGPADQDAPVLVPAQAPVSHVIIPIYMYHHVSNIPTTNQLDYNLTVTATDFSTQLTWMQKQGYRTITMPELFDFFYDGRALPKKPMILSFDDGYADVYTYALPALLAHHYRGVFYIITGMIGGNYMTWKEVRALNQSGMEIESHTIHHINLGEPPAYTSTQIELVKSKARLESILKKVIQFFCYPTGEPFHHDTVAEQKIVLKDLLLDGYLGATLDPLEYNSALQNSALPYEMPRIRVSGGENLLTFEGILSATLQADAVRLKAL